MLQFNLEMKFWLVWFVTKLTGYDWLVVDGVQRTSARTPWQQRRRPWCPRRDPFKPCRWTSAASQLHSQMLRKHQWLGCTCELQPKKYISHTYVNIYPCMTHCNNVIWLEVYWVGESQNTWSQWIKLTKDFLRVSKELAYNIFFLILAESGHHDIRNSFCFLELSAVPWHWCSYSKSYNPYLHSPSPPLCRSCRKSS